jgi:hypothetical protein
VGSRVSAVARVVVAAALAACSSRSGGGARGGGAPDEPTARSIDGAASADDPWLPARARPALTPAASAAPVASEAGSTVAPDVRRWIAGDLHMHVAPIDAREGAPLTIGELARRAPEAGLEFVIATPHVHPSTLADPARRKAWMASWRGMAADARAQRGVTIIPGAEYTVWHHGHYGVSGFDFTTLRGDDVLREAHDAGAMIVVNHPFATPTRIPGIPISEYDLSYRPWTEPGRARAAEEALLDGVEVWNLPLGVGNLISRVRGPSGEARAFVAADALARDQHRRVTAVGGSDSHRPHVVATTWVLAIDASEQAILAALRAGATCVGGTDGGTLVAHGDGDPGDHWARIGDVVRAREDVELRWTGRARLFVDGVDRGELDGGFVHHGARGPHTYRIEVGASRCGFVYANLAT